MGLISAEEVGNRSGATGDDEENEQVEGSVDNYLVEYSKSNRSLCKKCELKIEKVFVLMFIYSSL